MTCIVDFLADELKGLPKATVRSILAEQTSVYYGPWVAILCAERLNLFAPAVDDMVRRYNVSKIHQAYPTLLFEGLPDGSQDLHILSEVVRRVLQQMLPTRLSFWTSRAISFLKEIDHLDDIDGSSADLLSVYLKKENMTWCDEFMLQDSVQIFEL
jgi:hypothetical protein